MLLCFEAIPAAYGCRFVTTTEEAFALVERVNAVGFALLVDTATMFVNGDSVAQEVAFPDCGHERPH